MTGDAVLQRQALTRTSTRTRTRPSSTNSAAAAGLARGIRSRHDGHRAWRFSEPFASASRFLATGFRCSRRYKNTRIQKYKYQAGCTRARCASRRVGRRAGLLRGLEESPGSLALDQGRGRAKEPLGAWKLTCSKAELGGRGRRTEWCAACQLVLSNLEASAMLLGPPLPWL